MNSIRILIILFLTICYSNVFTQNLDSFFKLVENGEIERVREELPRLLESYPNNPGIIFLDAVTTEQAEEAIINYRKIVQYHPNSEYADDAIMKIGEYLFARGLYSQASTQLSKLPKVYPGSDHIQRAIDLQMNSLLAIGERDSLAFYLQLYKKKFLNLDLDYSFEPGKPLTNRSITKTSPGEIKMKSSSIKPAVSEKKDEKSGEDKVSESKYTNKIESSVSKPFIIQVGAYGSPENAIRQKMLLEQRGYDVHLGKINSRGKTLTVVQVQRYATKQEAEKVAKKLKSEFGYNYLILNRPE